MAKEEKPLEYQPRIRDTKDLAQRIDLEYLRPKGRAALLRRLSWILPVFAAAMLIPFFLGSAGGRRVFSNGPVSRSHALFGEKCENCHTATFSSVPDAACNRCHDGPAHPAKLIDTARPLSSRRCTDCHVEHRGNVPLADIGDRNCTSCHADLKQHATGLTIAATTITAFRPGRHPEFAAAGKPDNRPLLFKHASHLPDKLKMVKGIKLPVPCSECHATDRGSSKGDLLAVTFEQNCSKCHKRELEFDVYQVLGPDAPPAPHNKEPKLIHEIIAAAYEKALAADPSLVRRPLGREEASLASADWLARITADSEQFVFRKCSVCHVIEGMVGVYPTVAKVNRIRGRFIPGKVEGEPWLSRGEFNHRAHRAVTCESCHTAARASALTQDVLIPKMTACVGCHGNSGAPIDHCAACHLYHNKATELDKDRRPIDQLIGRGF